MKFAIETHQLVKQYKSTLALQGLDLQVPKGSIYGFVGPNGAGKTTTFNILSGFIYPTSGTAQILNFSLTNLQKYLYKIGVIPQDSNPYMDRKALDILTLYGRLRGFSLSSAKKIALDLLKKVQLEEKANEKLIHFSHGMKKRLDIAQAFLGDPEIILLDEPCSGLDPENAYHIRQLIKSFKKKCTIIYSSHNLKEIEDLCDEVAMIKSGKLIQSGSISDLTESTQSFTLHLKGNHLKTDALYDIHGIKEAFFYPESHKLEIKYQSSDINKEQAISAVMEYCIKNGMLVSDLKIGKSLEETYLKQQ